MALTTTDNLQYRHIMERIMKSYDQRCYDLAEIFLSDVEGSTEKECDELAKIIQEAIEDYIEFGREAGKAKDETPPVE